MKTKAVGPIIACALALFSVASWADLKSPTYKSAKDAYGKRNWEQADHLLRQYQAEDKAFLQKHSDVVLQIAAVTNYCERMLRSSVKSESIASVSDALDADDEAAGVEQPPPLP